MRRPRGPKYDTGTINDQLPLVPHGELLPKGEHCSGFLTAEQQGDKYEILCAECGVVIRRDVPESDLRQVFMELEGPAICSATCPHCGANNIYTGIALLLTLGVVE